MRLLPLFLLGVVVLSAQQAPPPQRHFGRGPGGDPDQMFEQRLTNRLGLTATQQNYVHTALAERAVIGKGAIQQMRTLNGSLVAAVKAGNEGQIDQISTQLAQAGSSRRQPCTPGTHGEDLRVAHSRPAGQGGHESGAVDGTSGLRGGPGPGPRGGRRGPPPGANGSAPAPGGNATPPPAAQ